MESCCVTTLKEEAAIVLHFCWPLNRHRTPGSFTKQADEVKRMKEEAANAFSLHLENLWCEAADRKAINLRHSSLSLGTSYTFKNKTERGNAEIQDVHSMFVHWLFPYGHFHDTSDEPKWGLVDFSFAVYCATKTHWHFFLYWWIHKFLDQSPKDLS